MESKNYLPTIIVAVIAAVASAVIWALIGILFNYELGIIAWAIGGLAGYAVGLVAKEHLTPLHQIIAVLAALVGIVLGKYSAFAYSYGRDSIAAIFDSNNIQVFQKNLDLFFGGYDIIFVILAIVTAWQIPVQLKQAEENKDAIHDHIGQPEDNQHAEELNNKEDVK